MQKFRDLRSDTSPLLNRAATAAKGVLIKLQEWRKTVSDNLMDLLTFLRLEAEIELQEKEIQQWEDELSVKMPVLAKHKDDMEDLKAELADIQELAKAADRWKDVSLRIGQKAITIQGKRSDLSILAHPVAAGRDRRTVDREHSQIMEEMERLSNKKTELNAEATKLNQQISLSAHLVSTLRNVDADTLLFPQLFSVIPQALNAESRAKEKATKFAEAERALNRKNEVLDLQKTLLDKEKLVRSVALPIVVNVVSYFAIYHSLGRSRDPLTPNAYPRTRVGKAAAPSYWVVRGAETPTQCARV
jgi:hypothetical protein